MTDKQYDLIVIGAGSAGLSLSLFLNKAGFKILLIDKSDDRIGGDCLNDGCVPSKALIHVARVMQRAKEAEEFGYHLGGSIDIEKVVAYIHTKQNIIRKHENAAHFRKEGLEIALGTAKFTGSKEIEVGGIRYTSKKFVIATGSRPRKLKVPGIEKVKYYDNESIFHLQGLPKRLLVVGGGPIGVEISQAMSRLGSKVTLVNQGNHILEHDDRAVTKVLQDQLEKEGIELVMNAHVEAFSNSNEAVIKLKAGPRLTLTLDAVFVAIGRELNTEELALEQAGIDIKNGKLVLNDALRTSNKNVFACGDVAGSLQFSHAAEQQARMLLYNFFAPFKKKLNNDLMSWVTFTDPEVATFGLQEKDLKKRGYHYRRLETNFKDDDRAITDSHQYGKLILYISQGNFLHKERILGGTMVAPGAGELVQELILAVTAKIPINVIFNKIYPYPVASRINQKAIVDYKQEALTNGLKRMLRIAFKIFS